MTRLVSRLLLASLLIAGARQATAQAAGAVGAKTAKKAAAAKPNVILVTIDTLRADHVGCYGDKSAQTPNLDSLCADGVHFTRAYTPVPTTLPAHSSILTGTFPMLHGMHDFSGNRLSPQQPTLATVLKQQGYATGAIVAAAVLDSRFGLNSGFDLYYDHFDFSRLAESNLEAMERPANEVMDQALGWLQQHRRKPFFLWVHLYDPHYPYNPPPPFAGKFKDRLYDGEIAFADSQLGRLLEYLKKHDLYRKAIMVVCGDHGEGLGEHEEKTHGFFIYNSTLHVPLIFKPAAKPNASAGAKSHVATANRSIDTPVSLVDILPTVLAAASAPLPPGLQGQDLMLNKASPAYSESFLARLHFNWSELRSLNRERYHFIEAPRPELYDTENDPGELHNLFPQKPAVSAEMRGELAGVIRQFTPASELAEKTSLDPAMLERLKSLGYAAVSPGSTATLSDTRLPDPKDRIATYELIAGGIEDSQHGRFEDSIKKLEAALVTEKDSVPVHYLLALDFYRQRDFAKAVREFSRVLELSPDYSLAAYYLGLAQAGSGEIDAAIDSFQRALTLDATNFSAAFNLGAAYLQKKLVPQAVAALERAIAINPEYAQAYRALGEIYLFEGNHDQALASLKRAAEIAPQDAKTHSLLARTYRAKGMISEAEAEMRKAERPQ